MMPAKRWPKWVRRTAWLAALVLLAGAYGAWLALTPQPPARFRVEGIVGVLFGLFIGAQPAGHFIDLLFFRSTVSEWLRSERGVAAWVLLNLFVFLVSWLVIFDGMTRIAAAR